ncbi:MAG: Fis family transcriptional regulator [Oxalobacter sp.]|nr:Fis family transcriptional regulator [Oxalobacter sp.]
MSREHIQDAVRRSLLAYFKDLDGQKPTDVYNMIIKTVEKPVLMIVMEQAGFVQSHAAEMLGINRNTLRKKLAEHDLLDMDAM